MTVFRRSVFLTAATVVVLGICIEPAFALTHHKHHKHHVHAANTSNTVVRIAQAHLMNLGYYKGKVDGVMGPQTRAAIKKFQHEHSLKADGVLGTKTNRALSDADPQKVVGTTSFATHDVVTGNDVPMHPDFAPNNMSGGNKQIMSRYGKIEVAQTGDGSTKRYSVTVNGQPILLAEGQPAVIGISPTYDLGQEDAVVFTTFSPSTTGCVYKSHVLIVDNNGIKLLDVDNCTREFQAKVDHNSLFLTYPEPDDNRAVGAVYRIEGATIQKL